MATSSKDFYDKVVASITADHPKFKIVYKDESLLMRFLAVLMFPFNEGFATQFTTTIGATTYFTTRRVVSADYSNYAAILAHEGVHVFDDAKHGWWFKLSYALNQAAMIPLLALFAVLGSWVPVAALFGGLAVSYGALTVVKLLTTSSTARRGTFFALAGLTVISYVLLAVWLSGWWTVLAVGAFVPLLPFTSHWRAKWEYRGYAMGLAIEYWMHGAVADSEMAWTGTMFTGPAYYFMDRSATHVSDTLKDIRASVLNGSILIGADARPYQRTLDVLKQLGLLKAGTSA